MSIKLSDFRDILNTILHDTLKGTTTGDGETDGSSLVDEGLTGYHDHYFRDAHVYLPDAEEERAIKGFLEPSGTLYPFRSFSSQVTSGKDYEIHQFPIDEKKRAINQALRDVYPYFYKPLKDTSLTGSGRAKYTVPAEFEEFPRQIWYKAAVDSLPPERLYDVVVLDRTAAGAFEFWSYVPSGRTIILLGRAQLSQFTDDDSTTELTEEQAEVVALKAASRLYQSYVTRVDSQDASRFDKLTARLEARYMELVRTKRMPLLLGARMDFSWLD